MTYAVIKTGGKQLRVAEGDVIAVEKLPGEKGDRIVFDEVLLVAREGEVVIGTPVVAGAKVTGEITAQTKDRKIVVFRMKRRKGYRKKTGHRQRITRLKVKEISL
ncbi:MAG TPA: 50S ribosomal protein L21 [Syntrophales bacterium]|nr:50S ribosomal protein L21 [Syntrophales bacterium]HOM07515.1 50S ribosomal protein L21 [Syntrophales bacterium]HON99842.1 50S ribosomal protein L21 [Syntrophales bacterium]HPC01441.1 50S ribosomal protein L21 [Syntrophales bacterium]HPQ07140.1 50S ribosomal protein L21 [Syntrophales bacterium]